MASNYLNRISSNAYSGGSASQRNAGTPQSGSPIQPIKGLGTFNGGNSESNNAFTQAGSSGMGNHGSNPSFGSFGSSNIGNNGSNVSFSEVNASSAGNNMGNAPYPKNSTPFSASFIA